VKSIGHIKNAASQPQDMHVRIGMKLVGCGSSKRILAGIEYGVIDTSLDEITVEMESPWRTNEDARGILEKTAAGDGPEAVAAKKELKRVKMAEDNIKLTHEETSRWLRLGYAYTYYSIQGRTIRDRTILLLDSTSKHFTVRNLIVGISRAPLGSQIKIPSVQEEEDFMHGLENVEDEVDLGAPAEEFQEEDVEEYEGEENEEEEEEEDEEED